MDRHDVTAKKGPPIMSGHENQKSQKKAKRFFLWVGHNVDIMLHRSLYSIFSGSSFIHWPSMDFSVPFKDIMIIFLAFLRCFEGPSGQISLFGTSTCQLLYHCHVCAFATSTFTWSTCSHITSDVCSWCRWDIYPCTRSSIRNEDESWPTSLQLLHQG